MLNFLVKTELESVNVNDLDNLIGKIELIDIREPYEYKSGSIKSAKNIPMGELLDETEKHLNKDTTYYIMCQSGARSRRASGILAKRGYNIINVSGGFGGYVGTKRK